MPAKVCQLTNIHSPLDQRIFYKEALSLAAAGYDITIVGPGPADLEGPRAGVHIRTIPAPQSPWERVLNLWRLFKAGWQVNAELYHLHDPELLPLGAVLRLLGKKVIYDVHEHFPQVVFVRAWIPDLLRRPVSFLVDALERFLAGWLSGVVGVVEEQAGRFGKGLFTPVKNFPRLEWFERHGHGLEPPVYDLIHVGSLSLERGGVFLLEIMNALRETHPGASLLSIGRFHTAKTEELFRQKLEQYDLAEKVECRTDRVAYDELGRIIQAGRIGLIPGQVSIQNLTPFVPTKLFEYLACGIPVVASALPSIRSFYAAADWGILVDPADARAHARAIGRLLDNPLEARAKGMRGRAVVEDKFNWDREAGRLLSFYQEVLDSQRR